MKTFMQSSESERREKMMAAVEDTPCALLVYLDGDLNVKSCAVTGKGDEHQVLSLLSSAASMAAGAVENTIF